MKTAWINLSPRKAGTSAMLAEMTGRMLSHPGTIYHYPDLLRADGDEREEWLSGYDVLVFSGPCYIMTYPADALIVFDLLKRHACMVGKKIYGIIQGGMPTLHTHEHGLESLKLFAGQCNAQYMGGFVMGLGAMLDGRPPEHLPNGKKVIKQLEIFAACVEKGIYADPKIYEAAEIKIPVPVLKAMAFSMNRSMIRDMKRRGIDYKAESPYRSIYHEDQR